MKKGLFIFLFLSITSAYAQYGWSVCNAPAFSSRVDDIFMAGSDTGYAVCGDGRIVKSTDGGNNWSQLLRDSSIYCRSVEFVTTLKGFVGAFSRTSTANILRKTIDGGITWADISTSIDPRALRGICGLAAPDTNTIYGCGNWFGNSGYIIKSLDGGTNWQFIDMADYASAVIDMNFSGKDTGFAVGKDTTGKAIVLYTVNGGQSWSVKYRNTDATDNGYVWKIQRLSNRLYYGSIESLTGRPPKIIRSEDGGMTWQEIFMNYNLLRYYVEGVGFIDPQKGWTGGDAFTFETTDGGNTWRKINACPGMNRVWRVNDSLILATGDKIWKYKAASPLINEPPGTPAINYIDLKCYPNPVVNNNITADLQLKISTHITLVLYDESGKTIKVIANTYKPAGKYRYVLDTRSFLNGSYVLVLKTHEDKKVQKIIVAR